MKYIQKKYNLFIPVIEKFISGINSFSDISINDKLEILLSLESIGILTPSIKKKVEFISKLDINDLNIVNQLTRQLILIKYDIEKEERKNFLNYWILEGNHKKEDLITISWIFGLGVEDKANLDEKWMKYFKDFFIKTSKTLKSITAKSWMPNYLEKLGFNDISEKIIASILASRENNGSWDGNFEKTIRVAYALSTSNYCKPIEMQKTLSYIENKLDRIPQLTFKNSSLILKLFFRFGRFEDDLKQYILNQIQFDSNLIMQKDLKQLLLEGDIKKAITEVKSHCNGSPNLENELILIASRMNNIEEFNRLGIITYEDYNSQRNRIIFSLLEFIDKNFSGS